MPKGFVALPTTPGGTMTGQVRVHCPGCGEMIATADLSSQAMVCPWCDFHFPLEALPRLNLLADEGSFRALENTPAGPNLFGRATLLDRPLALALGDPSIRWTAAEVHALISLAERARLEKLPLFWVVTAPQGVEAEALWPGVQASLNQLREAGLPCIALLAGSCHGALAAAALQADLVLAEPGAVVAPLLPEVLRQAGRLPPQRTRSSRRLLREGWADAVLPRREQRATLANVLDYLGPEGKSPGRPPRQTLRKDKVRLSRPLEVLVSLTDYYELHGDRSVEDDPALVGGLARLRADGGRVLVLATAEDSGRLELRRRVGTLGAAGWRKGARLLRLAGRFGLPVVILVGRADLRAGRRDRPDELAAALGDFLSTLLAAPVPTVAVRLERDTGLAGQALSAADCVLAREEIEADLRRGGIRADDVFAGAEGLGALLAQHLQQLIQTYAVHGPLGRRKLLQRRHARWTRLFREEGALPSSRRDPGAEV